MHWTKLFLVSVVVCPLVRVNSFTFGVDSLDFVYNQMANGMEKFVRMVKNPIIMRHKNKRKRKPYSRKSNSTRGRPESAQNYLIIKSKSNETSAHDLIKVSLPAVFFYQVETTDKIQPDRKNTPPLVDEIVFKRTTDKRVISRYTTAKGHIWSAVMEPKMDQNHSKKYNIIIPWLSKPKLWKHLNNNQFNYSSNEMIETLNKMRQQIDNDILTDENIYHKYNEMKVEVHNLRTETTKLLAHIDELKSKLDKLQRYSVNMYRIQNGLSTSHPKKLCKCFDTPPRRPKC